MVREPVGYKEKKSCKYSGVIKKGVLIDKSRQLPAELHIMLQHQDLDAAYKLIEDSLQTDHPSKLRALRATWGRKKKSLREEVQKVQALGIGSVYGNSNIQQCA